MPSKMKAARGVEAVGHAQVRRRAVEALRGEPDAEQPLRRAALVAPQRAELAVRREVVLAGRRLVRPRAGLGAADLHHVRLLGVVRDDPVEAVAAQVHHAPAAGDVGLDRVELGQRHVLRVAAGQHHAVRREQLDALAIQVLVGDHVEADLLRVEPVDDAEVGRELPERVHAHPGAVARIERDDRAGAATSRARPSRRSAPRSSTRRSRSAAAARGRGATPPACGRSAARRRARRTAAGRWRTPGRSRSAAASPRRCAGCGARAGRRTARGSRSRPSRSRTA